MPDRSCQGEQLPVTLPGSGCGGWWSRCWGCPRRRLTAVSRPRSAFCGNLQRCFWNCAGRVDSCTAFQLIRWVRIKYQKLEIFIIISWNHIYLSVITSQGRNAMNLVMERYISFLCSSFWNSSLFCTSSFATGKFRTSTFLFKRP